MYQDDYDNGGMLESIYQIASFPSATNLTSFQCDMIDEIVQDCVNCNCTLINFVDAVQEILNLENLDYNAQAINYATDRMRCIMESDDLVSIDNNLMKIMTTDINDIDDIERIIDCVDKCFVLLDGDKKAIFYKMAHVIHEPGVQIKACACVVQYLFMNDDELFNVDVATVTSSEDILAIDPMRFDDNRFAITFKTMLDQKCIAHSPYLFREYNVLFEESRNLEMIEKDGLPVDEKVRLDNELHARQNQLKLMSWATVSIVARLSRDVIVEITKRYHDFGYNSDIITRALVSLGYEVDDCDESVLG